MVYTEDYVYVACGSMAKWRDCKTPCTQRKKNLENCGIPSEIAPSYLNSVGYAKSCN